jgi:hypothetical protein
MLFILAAWLLLVGGTEVLPGVPSWEQFKAKYQLAFSLE